MRASFHGDDYYLNSVCHGWVWSLSFLSSLVSRLSFAGVDLGLSVARVTFNAGEGDSVLILILIMDLWCMNVKARKVRMKACIH